MLSDETDDLIDQIASGTVRLINSNLALAKRVAGGGADSPGSDEPLGPVQDAWMTWADCAGDLVTISYLAAQLADVVVGSPGRRRRRPDKST